MKYLYIICSEVELLLLQLKLLKMCSRLPVHRRWPGMVSLSHNGSPSVNGRTMPMSVLLASLSIAQCMVLP